MSSMHRKLGTTNSNPITSNFEKNSEDKFSSKYSKRNVYYIPIAILTLCFLLILSASIFFRYTYLWEYTTLADNIRPIQRTTCELPQITINESIHTPALRFDWKDYLQKNADLVGAGLTDKKQAWQHFKNFGKKENRKYSYSDKVDDLGSPLQIGVIMMYEITDNLPKAWKDDILQALIKNRQDYCDKHGYTLLNVNSMLNYSRPASWSKLLALKHHFIEDEFDYLFYMDMDVIIMNDEIKLESFIDYSKGKFDFIMTSDHNGPNAGVFMVKHTTWALNFMQELWNQEWLVPNLYVPLNIMVPFYWEQRAFHYMLNTKVWKRSKMPTYPGDSNEIKSHFLLLPQCAFNSYILHPFDYICNRETQNYATGDFLIHFAGKEGGSKYKLMKYYIDLLNANKMKQSPVASSAQVVVVKHQMRSRF